MDDFARMQKTAIKQNESNLEFIMLQEHLFIEKTHEFEQKEQSLESAVLFAERKCRSLLKEHTFLQDQVAELQAVVAKRGLEEKK